MTAIITKDVKSNYRANKGDADFKIYARKGDVVNAKFHSYNLKGESLFICTTKDKVNFITNAKNLKITNYENTSN